MSDAKRSELLAKGSFLQLILYGYSYRRKYAMVVHTTKVEEESKTGLSILCTKDHQDYINKHIIKKMETLTSGLATNPSSFCQSFFSPVAITNRSETLTKHIEQCSVPDISSLQVPSLVQLQKQTQKIAALYIEECMMEMEDEETKDEKESKEEVLAPTSKLDFDANYQRWSKFLIIDPSL